LGQYTQPNPFLGKSPALPAQLGTAALMTSPKIEKVPFGSVQMDEFSRLFPEGNVDYSQDPTMGISPAPNAAADQSNFLNQNMIDEAIQDYAMSPYMSSSSMGLGDLEVPEDVIAPPEKKKEKGEVSDPKAVGFFGDDKAKNMALLELGARLMAGQSPYALQNLGTAGVGTLQSIRERQKDVSDRLLKERLLDIQEREATAKEKELEGGAATADRQIKQIYDSMMSKKNRGVKEFEGINLEGLNEPEMLEAAQNVYSQRVASAALTRAGTGAERQNLELRKVINEEKIKLKYQDPEIMEAFSKAGKDKTKLAAAERLLEDKATRSALGGLYDNLSLSPSFNRLSPDLMGGNATDIMLKADAILGQ